MTSTTLADDKTQQQAELLAAAEELLHRAAQGEPLTFEQMQVFRSLGWDDWKFRREKSRAYRARQWCEKAGTQPDRDAAVKRLEDAQAKAAKERPKLEAEIAKLQAKLAAIDNEAHEAQRVVDEHREACEALRGDLLPVLTRERINHLKRQANERCPVQSLESQIDGIDRLAALRFDVAEEYEIIRGHAQFHKLGNFPIDASGAPREPWHQFIAQRKQEREQLVAELERMRAEREPLEAEIERLRNYYLDN